MTGNSRRKFTIDRPQARTQPREDFAAVFAGTFTDQPAIPMDLPIDAIEPSPYQARQEFADLEELADSIRTHGFTSRIRVRPHPINPDRYQLVYGERRLRAARLAGLSMLPCDVAQHSDADLREIGLIENLQRQDLAALEEARAFRLMLDENGYSIRSLAERIGKSKGYIQNKLDLLRAPEDVQEMVNAHAETQSAGLIIAQLPTQEQRRPLIEGVVAGTLDTKAVRDMVQMVRSAEVPVSQGPSSAHAGSPHTERSSTYDGRRSASDRVSAEDSQNRRAGERGAEAAERRQVRQSERVLAQTIQTLRTMSAQVHGAASQLRPAERSALLDYVVREHFPELEQLVEELRS
ncbi:MAG TPA: ParB/RepB/Spo0J family partition protein [Herpetosiphonaceae bacterium]